MALNRKIEVIIGPEGSAGTKVTEELKIAFEVEKTGLKTINSASVKIWNLSKATAEKMSKVGNAFVLRAGYADEGGAKGLFFGKVTKSTLAKDPPDTVLEIEASDGGHVLKEKFLTLSYTEGTGIRTILTDILDVIGLPIGNEYTLPTLEYAGGFAFIGKASDALSQVLDRAKLNWSIQNSQIYILADKEGYEVQALNLNYNSGLLTAPERLLDSTGEKALEDLPARYQIQCLLYPQIVPGALVTISTPDVLGSFKIESASFTGDSYEGEFMVTAVIREQK